MTAHSGQRLPITFSTFHSAVLWRTTSRGAIRRRCPLNRSRAPASFNSSSSKSSPATDISLIMWLTVVSVGYGDLSVKIVKARNRNVLRNTQLGIVDAVDGAERRDVVVANQRGDPRTALQLRGHCFAHGGDYVVWIPMRFHGNDLGAQAAFARRLEECRFSRMRRAGARRPDPGRADVAKVRDMIDGQCNAGGVVELHCRIEDFPPSPTITIGAFAASSRRRSSLGANMGMISPSIRCSFSNITPVAAADCSCTGPIATR